MQTWLMQNRCCGIGCLFYNSSNADALLLLLLMILRNFISLRAFTVYMKNSLQFEISLQSNGPKWNLHRSEFNFDWSHANTDKEVTFHQSKILFRSEIWNQFEFTSSLDCSEKCWSLKNIMADISVIDLESGFMENLVAAFINGGFVRFLCNSGNQ